MKRLAVYRKGVVAAIALVSGEDADLAESFWTLSSKGYVRRRTPRTEYLHRVVAARILGRPLGREQQVHHREGRLDNRRESLVVCADHLEHKAQHFAHPGVRWEEARGRWLARPTICGVKVFLGRHETKEAAIAVVEAAR